MNAPEKLSKPTGLALLREPFPAHQISKLPKPTKAQTDEVKADFKKGVRCDICGGWHHPKVVHLDYVGHAALTDRLLDADPAWYWEPLTIGQNGTPVLDESGGLWIKLTVCGVTRLGYGDAQGKTGGDAMKERIGDALRNAAMRFGAALDLWHKGDLHIDEDGVIEAPKPIPESAKSIAKSDYDKLTPERQNALTDLATEIKDAFSPQSPEIAYDVYRHVMEALPLIEEKAALKSLLDSKIRSAFVKIYKERNTQLTPAGELATQA